MDFFSDIAGHCDHQRSTYGMVFISLLLLLLFSIEDVGFGKWCPPNLLHNGKRRQSTSKTALISQIYGVLDVPKDNYFFVYPTDDHISRQLYFHIGLLGIDHVYFTTYYNASLSSPSVEDVFPSRSSCVRKWYELGLFTWETIPYLEFTEKLQTDGINSMYNRIRVNYDWVIVSDIDELILPTNWHPTTPKWCSFERPAVIQLALQQIQVAATTKYLQDFETMETNWQERAAGSDACLMGSALNIDVKTKKLVCTEIAYILLPAYYWRTPYTDNAALSSVRCRFTGAYGYDNETVPRTKELNNQGQTWKSIHRTSTTPLLSGELTMHLGVGFSILAPRHYHRSGVSLEVAHLRSYDYEWKANYLMNDTRIVDLFASYEECLTGLDSNSSSSSAFSEGGAGSTVEPVQRKHQTERKNKRTKRLDDQRRHQYLRKKRIAG